MGKEVKTRGEEEGNRVGTLRPRRGHQAGFTERGQETEVLLGAWEPGSLGFGFQRGVAEVVGTWVGQSLGRLRPPGDAPPVPPTPQVGAL